MQKLTHGQLAKLVKNAQKGDESAFAVLYAATVESQLYFAVAFLQDSYLAEDAVQTTYMALYESLPKLENPRLLVAYLNRICYNTCVDMLKKSSRSKGELGEDKLSCINDKTAAHDPAESYLLLEENREIYRALAALPAQQKAMFLMRYYHDMKIHEIALALNTSESTVKRGLKAATDKLRPIFA
ncbi:MAG: RNA polymerase sigma factor [Clostridiales bacterium]|nr:RNA polymerase sigma factor [Clostridiales bacterium]